MSEWKHLISEWLSEYASLQENEIKSFAAEHEHNHEIATALFNLFYSDAEPENPGTCQDDSKNQHEVLLEEVCTQLFSFYRSKEVELQRFTLQFVPTLIYNYLSSISQSNKKTYRCMETLLISLYNFEVVDENGKPKTVSFRLPSLAQSSIYHEPLSLGSQFLTESALRRWEECNTKLVSWGPLPQVEVIVAQNRLKVLAALLFIFNRQLSLLPKLALRHFCIAASRIVTQGFDKKLGQSKSKPTPRIAVSPNFLLELIEGAYYAMFNEFYTLALQAVMDIDQRAQYELFPDVMLVTSAVINSLQNNPSGQPIDGPMGISVALSPATTTVTMSKSMITNASFRTKKLPDDRSSNTILPNECSWPPTLGRLFRKNNTYHSSDNQLISFDCKLGNTISNKIFKLSDSGYWISSLKKYNSDSSLSVSSESSSEKNDIPIQAGQVVPTESNDMLSAITEEGESEVPIQRGLALRNSKPKLSAFPVLGKKTKDAKEKAGTTEKKVTLKESSKGIWNSLGGGDMVDSQQKTDHSVDGNGSLKDEVSLTSGLNSTENSDSRSHVTTDSLEMETTSRFTGMQVSSV